VPEAQERYKIRRGPWSACSCPGVRVGPPTVSCVYGLPTRPDQLLSLCDRCRAANDAQPGATERDATLIDKLLSGALAEVSSAERSALADRARREIETNRYPLAPQLGPLKSAFKKLAPADDLPRPPAGGRRKARR
jgi:hypothetical protein